MTAGEPRRKVLVVGPLGDRPWLTADELRDQLEALDYEVILNIGRSDLVVPYPDPLPSSVGARANALPRVAWWSVRMLWRWRRTARQALTEGAFTQILVWDTVLAALYRFARPPGVEVVWVKPAPEGQRVHQRIVRAAVTRVADRVVAEVADDAAWAATALGRR